MKAKLYVVKLFGLSATAYDELSDIVGTEYNLLLVTQPGGVWIALPNAVCKAITERWIVSLHRRSDYGAAYGYIAFTHAVKVLCSEESCITWFSCLFDTVRQWKLS